MSSCVQLPFFSIIVPIYNCEKYLEECIESVIKQTYSSWELILVDDGSTDKSREICDKYDYDLRVKVIHQKNMGAFRSRLNGIANAVGKYELGLDADDYLEPNCLEVIKNAIDSSGSDLIFYSIRCFGKQKGKCIDSLMPGKKYSKEEILREIISKTNHSLCNKAIRLDVVKQTEYGGLSVKERILNDDYALIVPIACNINSGYVVNNVLYNYRIYEESSSHIMCTVDYILDTGFVTDFIIQTMEASIKMDKVWYEVVYISYLHMISARLMNLFINREITIDECKSIHASQAYANAYRYELRRNCNLSEYVFLKLFRHNQYWLLDKLALLYRAKHNVTRK